MKPEPPPASTAGRRGERGMAMIELAFVALLLFSFSAAAIDYGMGWRSGLVVTEATRAAARAGSALGPQDAVNTGREADFYALSSAKAALNASGKLSQVQRVVIYRATAADGQPTTACKTGGGDSSCSIISGDNFRTAWDAGTMVAATQSNGCLLVASPKNFCPTGRTNSPQGSAEYLGIYIEIRHPYLFPLLGSGVNVGRMTVMRIEPKAE